MRLWFALVLVGSMLLGAGCGNSGEAEDGQGGAAGSADDGGVPDGGGDPIDGGLDTGTGGAGGSDGTGGTGGDPSGGTGGNGNGGTGGSGGDGSGGSGGGSGDGSGGGSHTCRVLANLVASALAEAQRCTSSASCDLYVPGMSCPEVVSSANHTAIATYTGRLHADFVACGAPDCSGVVCTGGQAAHCAANGRCELP